MAIVEPIFLLLIMQFSIGIPVGLAKRRFLISTGTSLVYLAVSPRLIYSIDDLALAIAGYFVSFGGLLILFSALPINYLGWLVGSRLGNRIHRVA